MLDKRFIEMSDVLTERAIDRGGIWDGIVSLGTKADGGILIELYWIDVIKDMSHDSLDIDATVQRVFGVLGKPSWFKNEKASKVLVSVYVEIEGCNTAEELEVLMRIRGWL